MALHPEFPTSPYTPLIPAHRWFPAADKQEGGMVICYDFLYVDEDSFRKHNPTTLADLAAGFTEYNP